MPKSSAAPGRLGDRPLHPTFELLTNDGATARLPSRLVFRASRIDPKARKARPAITNAIGYSALGFQSTPHERTPRLICESLEKQFALSSSARVSRRERPNGLPFLISQVSKYAEQCLSALERPTRSGPPSLPLLCHRQSSWVARATSLPKQRMPRLAAEVCRARRPLALRPGARRSEAALGPPG